MLDVTVRNTVITIISDAKLKAIYDKKTHTIKFKGYAKGYISAEKEISIANSDSISI